MAIFKKETMIYLVIIMKIQCLEKALRLFKEELLKISNLEIHYLYLNIHNNIKNDQLLQLINLKINF